MNLRVFELGPGRHYSGQNSSATLRAMLFCFCERFCDLSIRARRADKVSGHLTRYLRTLGEVELGNQLKGR